MTYHLSSVVSSSCYFVTEIGKRWDETWYWYWWWWKRSKIRKEKRKKWDLWSLNECLVFKISDTISVLGLGMLSQPSAFQTKCIHLLYDYKSVVDMWCYVGFVYGKVFMWLSLQIMKCIVILLGWGFLI